MSLLNNNRFLIRNPEKSEYNQYWYSKDTIQTFVRVIEEHLQESSENRVAFMSTPSVYFSMTSDLQQQAKLFEFDKKWEKDQGFVFWDFNQPDNVDSSLLGTFSLILIDPPFITREVWENYTSIAKKLGKPGCKLICSTISENADMMKNLLEVTAVEYQPSIPHLVYQYNLYTNFKHDLLQQKNSELSE
ncbi:hypothetical protein C9374_008014 [Naegleria lovaniensis]|uniref:N6-adenine methyltransferase n=1 Tax=Naegleria lovaniensis TaxID=51637 RepID=A0AA88KI45_NAELO|nr:uncharacterized protein C9374_008014 [Naegleria lovaniensis]KAG2378866.1 hypothetical protein C9374_008014 [Naegleria lovaniensis]